MCSSEGRRRVDEGANQCSTDSRSAESSIAETLGNLAQTESLWSSHVTRRLAGPRDADSVCMGLK
jgi:hypothetical protein